MDSKPELLIGSQESDYLRVTPLSRGGVELDDYWDSNWVDSLIELACGGFTASYRANLRTDEFVSFRKQLAPLYDELSGRATFASMETWLSIRVEGNGLGSFEAACEACDNPSFGSSLSFSLGFDQTHLPGIVRALRLVEERFPVVGSPAA